MEGSAVVIEHPNRDKAESKATKAVVVLLFLASALCMAIVTIFGWSALEGQKGLQIAYIVLYIVVAYYVSRWNRGALPIGAALATILLIFCLIAGPGWFDRDKTGFAQAESLFGGTGLEASVLGLITLLLVPIQILIVAFAMAAFRQEWSVEVERPVDDRGSAPAAA